MWRKVEKRTDQGRMVLLELSCRLQGRLLGRLGLRGQRPMRGGVVAEERHRGVGAVLGGRRGAVRRTIGWVLPLLVQASLVRAAVCTVQGMIRGVTMESVTRRTVVVQPMQYKSQVQRQQHR